MKRTVSATHGNRVSYWAHTRRENFDLFATAGKGHAAFAFSRLPANYRWQAHGEGRSFHQAPIPAHISRTPRG